MSVHNSPKVWFTRAIVLRLTCGCLQLDRLYCRLRIFREECPRVCAVFLALAVTYIYSYRVRVVDVIFATAHDLALVC